MMRDRFLQCLSALALLPMAACRLLVPNPTRPVRVLSFAPRRGKTTELVVLLPGRLSQPEEFVKYGLVDLVRAKRPQALIVAPDLHMGYYMAGKADVCLHEEIIHEAHLRGESVTLLGVSMGGLGALIYSLRYPQEVQEVLLLSPFVGEEKLLSEIEASGGLQYWQSAVEVPRNKEEALQKTWGEIKRQWLPKGGPPVPMKLVVGKQDRLLSSNQFFAKTLLMPEQYHEIEGGHEWECWRRGAEILLR
jgi:pimeloyl-ACP methyl ester carboxylesterase